MLCNTVMARVSCSLFCIIHGCHSVSNLSFVLSILPGWISHFLMILLICSASNLGSESTKTNNMRTTIEIKTVLVCDTCHRIQVVQGYGYWCRIPYLDAIDKVLLDVTRCWMCKADMTSDTDKNAMRDVPMRLLIDMVKDTVGYPNMVNLDYLEEKPYGGESMAELSYGSVDTKNLASRDMSIIVKGLDYSHVCYSITSIGYGDPHTDFLRHGWYPDKVGEYFHMPFKCTGVLVHVGDHDPVSGTSTSRA